MEQLLILLFLLVAVIIIKLKLANNTKATKKEKGSKVNYDHFAVMPVLLTPAERSFYGVLMQAVQDKALVFAKIRVIDVIGPVKGLTHSDRLSAVNRVQSKHFDYVLCDPSTLAFLSAVELDDKSHLSTKAQNNDHFKDRLCAFVGLKLHRVKASSTYNVQEIREMLFPESILTDKERALLGLNVDQ